MLRHACGFALADKGHDTGRCRRISAIATSSNTACYTELSPGRSQGLLAVIMAKRKPSLLGNRWLMSAMLGDIAHPTQHSAYRSNASASSHNRRTTSPGGSALAMPADWPAQA